MVAILENGCPLCPGKDYSGPLVKNYDIMRDNLAHPTKIDFLLGAALVTKTTF